MKNYEIRLGANQKYKTLADAIAEAKTFLAEKEAVDVSILADGEEFFANQTIMHIIH